MHREAQVSVTHAKSDIRAKEYLQGALAADDFLLHAQKVVSLEQPAAALGYELLPRVRLQGRPHRDSVGICLWRAGASPPSIP